MSEYKDLIQLMEATPKVPTPDRFTERVMGRLAAEQRLSIWQLLRRTLAETREISWTSFAGECTQGRNACFYFLIAGLFFFFIGSVLFSSGFFIGYTSRAMGFIMIQSILVLMAAISLVAAGMMMAARVPDASYWAKRALMVYGILIIANAFLIQANSKMALGEVFALTFGTTGMLMGMVLMRALQSKTNETTAC